MVLNVHGMVRPAHFEPVGGRWATGVRQGHWRPPTPFGGIGKETGHTEESVDAALDREALLGTHGEANGGHNPAGRRVVTALGVET